MAHAGVIGLPPRRRHGMCLALAAFEQAGGTGQVGGPSTFGCKVELGRFSLKEKMFSLGKIFFFYNFWSSRLPRLQAFTGKHGIFPSQRFSIAQPTL